MIHVDYVRQDAGLVNTDMNAYRSATARRDHDKYIKSLETRICKLECAMEAIQNTVKEMIK